jgi:hypothetical protein
MFTTLSVYVHVFGGGGVSFDSYVGSGETKVVGFGVVTLSNTQVNF